MDDEDFWRDECRMETPASADRFFLFAVLGFAAIPGAVIVYNLLNGSGYRLQFASAIADTAAVVLYTFAANRNNNPPYMFSCPVVQNQFPRLLRRHAGFLAALFLFQTAALRLQQYLSPYWRTSSGTDPSPFTVALIIFTGILAITQILTNRSILEQAHLDDNS
jgi:hypothetical protein